MLYNDVVTNILLTFIGGMLGTIFTFVFTKYFADKKEKKDVILDMYKEYSSPDYAVHRRRAYALLTKFPGKSWTEYRELDVEGSMSLDVLNQ